MFTRVDATGARHVLADALGSALALTDSSGSVTTEYTYSPFGETVRVGDASSNPTQFTGRENDSTGLYFYRGRYLHPRLQRFVSEDPVGFLAGDPNLYAYVFNAPRMHTDPSGELAPIAPIVGAAAVRCLRAAAESAVIDYASGRKIDWHSAGTDCALDALLLPGGSRAGRAAWAARPSSRTARRTWERHYGREWPTEPNGRNYDAHHRDPIADGGDPRNPVNIEPLPRRNHVEHHR